MAQLPWRGYARIPWSSLAPFLPRSRTSDRDSRPSWKTCPRCRGPLRLFSDVLLGGEWGWCRSCQLSGHPFRLLAEFIKQPLEDVRAWLTKRRVLLPDDPDGRALAMYQERVVQASIAAWLFWEEAKKEARYPTRPRSSSLLVECLGREVRALPASSWNQVLQDLVGICEAKQMRDFTLRWTDRKLGALGYGDEEPLAIAPALDLPGRIVGFSVVHRGKKGELGRFRNEHIPVCDYAKREAGLVGLPLLFRPTSGVGSFLLIQSLTAFWRFQTKIAMADTDPLPLLLYADRGACKTKAAWRVIDNKKNLVIWGGDRNWASMKTAAHLGCQIYTSNTQERKAAKLWDAPDVFPRLQQVIARAVPWTYRASRELARGHLANWMGFLESLTPAQRQSLRRKVLPEQQWLLEDYPEQELSFTEGNYRISARESGWYVEKLSKSGGGSVLLSDVRFYVDWVWPDPLDRCLVRILYQGKTYRVRKRWSEVRRPSTKWLEDYFRNRGWGVPYVRSPSPLSLISIALRLSPPKTAAESLRGWDSRTQTLRFRRWQIEVGQAPTSVEESPATPWHDHIARPKDLSADLVTTLQEPGDAGDYVWAFLLATVSSALSYPFGDVRPTLLLAGDLYGQEQTRRLMRAIGFSSHTRGGVLPSLSKRPGPGRIHWLRGRRCVETWLTQPGVFLLRSHRVPAISKDLLLAARQAWPLFVSSAVESRADVGFRGPLIYRVLVFLATRFPELIPLTMIDRVRRRLRVSDWPNDLGAGFLEMLVDQHCRGQLPFRSLRQESDSDVPYVVAGRLKKRRMIFCPLASLNRLAQSHRRPFVAEDVAISKMLFECKVSLRESWLPWKGLSGMALDREVWNTAVAEYKAQQLQGITWPNLRVVLRKHRHYGTRNVLTIRNPIGASEVRWRRVHLG